MTWQGWLAVTLIGLSILLGTTGKADDSKYIPECFERHCKVMPKNTVYVLTGPTNLTVAGEPNETSMTFGYMRLVLPDLSVGGGVLGTNKRFLGVQFGLGYHF